VFLVGGGQRERKTETEKEIGTEFCGRNEGLQQLVTGWWHVF
jgi:hypothetical protein